MVIWVVFATGMVFGQKRDTIQPDLRQKHKWWYVGAGFTNSWTSFNSYTQENLFFKPSLGGYVLAEFYPIKYVGFQTGFGFTQRGAGILLPDLHSEPDGSDADSTYRMRLRTNNFYFPVAIVLKTPELFKNFRISATGGIAPSYVFGSHRVMQDTDGGFHNYTEVNENFKKWDVNIHASLGIEFMGGFGCIFRMHALAHWGTLSAYRYPGAGNYSGKNVLYGIQLTVLY